MSRSTLQITDTLHDYIYKTFIKETPVLKKCREETAGMANADMQIAPGQGQFMAFLIKILQPEKALEIGVFTGYSSLWVALALPPGGRMIACDTSKEYTDRARTYWKEAGVEDKIELRLGPGVETLETLLAQGQAGTFDFFFLDADKANYPLYYEKILSLLRYGGVLVVDNVFWDGEVENPKATDPDTEGIRTINVRSRNDPGVETAVLPVADGVLLIYKK